MTVSENTMPSFYPPNHIPSIEGLDEPTLLSRRAQLTAKARGDGRDVPPIDLSIEETEELCAIYARLRSRKGGPPDGTKRKASRKMLVVDDLSDI